MRITTNYSRSDWCRLLASLPIILIPGICLVFVLIWYLESFLPIWTDFVDFLTNDDVFKRFIESSPYNGGDKMLVFGITFLLGSAMFPILLASRILYWFPSMWIINRLGIAPRMKLVIFYNDKPIKWKK